MGCDIHAFVEYRTRTPSADRLGGWHGFGEQLWLGRHYGIFCRLAGVRCREESTVEQRGVPEDADDLVRWGQEKDPGHSASWVTADEWEAAIHGWEEIADYRAVLAALRAFEQEGYETRVVFWFDS